MIEHKKCRLPAGLKMIRGIDDGKIQRRYIGQPMHAFLTEDSKDPTTLIIWIPDCPCLAERRCPRAKAFAVANTLNYDNATVRLWPPPSKPSRVTKRRR